MTCGYQTWQKGSLWLGVACLTAKSHIPLTMQLREVTWRMSFLKLIIYGKLVIQGGKSGSLKNETKNIYYKVITKCDKSLLKSALGITKCESYYKVRRNMGWRIRKKQSSKVNHIEIFQVQHIMIYSKFKVYIHRYL